MSNNIIDKIQLSGVTYDIGGQGGSGVSVVEVTQVEYDALPTSAKTDTSKMYVITDAEAGDLTQYWTSAQTQSAITEATSGKVDSSSIVSSVTSASTDSEIPTAKAVWDAIPTGGTSITIDPSLDSGSTNPVANSAITNNTLSGGVETNDVFRTVRFRKNNGQVAWYKRYAAINGSPILVNGTVEAPDFQLVETSAITTSITSDSTDSQVPSAKAVYDAIEQGGGGGGKAIEAGRGISVTTGETADTVSFNLPISAGTGVDSITEGDRTTASGDYSHTEGGYSIANGNYSHAEGMATITYGMSSHAEGYVTEARNKYEHASGAYNVSSSATTEFGHSGNTLFSVGNGTSSSAKHNAFEIRQNGDIYISSGGTDIKLQDHLGGGGGEGISSAECQTMIDNSISGKADSDDVYTTGQTSGATELATAFAATQPKLSAGTGISIDANNVISATGGGGGGKAIEAGRGIAITTGATADTVSFDLPISAGTGNNSILMSEGSIASGSKSIAGGQGCQATREGTIALGQISQAEAKWAVAIGNLCKASGRYSMAVCNTNTAIGESSFAEGYNTMANNSSEHASGYYNVSNTGSTDADKTLFSVGNGTGNARHNAFEIRQNGDIYYFDGTNDVKLQDKFSSIDTTIGDINTILQSI